MTVNQQLTNLKKERFIAKFSLNQRVERVGSKCILTIHLLEIKGILYSRRQKSYHFLFE